jgi:O-acetylserine/cysteine efflux transporter
MALFSAQQEGSPRFGPGAVTLAMFVNLMFALNIVAMKVVVDATAPFTSVALRMGIVFLCCAPALRRVPGRTGWLALYGAINGGLFLLVLNFALMMADNVGALAIAGQLSVPFSLLLGALLLRETLSPVRIAGVAIAFAGVAMLVFDPAIAREVPAVLTMAAAAMLWGLGTLVQRRLDGVSVMNSQAWNGLMGAAILLPFALLLERPAIAGLTQIGWRPAAWLAFSCLGSTIAGQGALAWLLQRHPIGSVMPLMLLSPVLATMFASAYFGTAITPIMVMGGLVALVGVALLVLIPQPAR